MKVYIGPYISTWRAGKFFDWWIEKTHKKVYWDVSKKDYTKLDILIDDMCDIVQVILNKTVNRFFEWKGRKIKVHIDYYDVWSMDHTLALIVVPLLKKLKEVKHGSPFVEDEDVPEHLRSTAATPLTEKQIENGSTDDLFHDRWVWVLEEMIHAFECELDDDWDRQFYSGEHDLVWEEHEESGYSKMKIGPKNTFQVDRASMDVAWARRKNGLRLFGKYYHGLWD
jgi:hypothetical protein